ncbi:methyltransferase type 12 [Paenibacillus stellifer]|uniref:Methyltransferase type 12 n=1 Tax=Paenibacillus stellifer TaxID=169760 RepID=A0A089LV88_9BACL|nr:class I SAM-dependent methyltransferase [Paenibacillus stellifer]AIQ65416.1 methyltransferase type 12 [Paenibacillus stellifer]
MDKFAQARAEEIKYHEDFYASNTLFEPGTWLSKPVKIVMEMLEALDVSGIRVLDLGCGVGRNSIPIAQRIKEYEGTVTCIDLIPKAIELLEENAKAYEVEDCLLAEASDAEFYPIEPDYYNYIIACSCLEHVSSVGAFEGVVTQMIKGTKNGGINTILMSTDIQDYDLATGELTEGLIELNLETHKAYLMLEELYSGWEILMERDIPQKITEQKHGKQIEFRCNWVTFVARKADGIRSNS